MIIWAFAVRISMPSTLGKIFSRRHIEILFQKIGFDISCKLSSERRRFACNVKDQYNQFVVC